LFKFLFFSAVVFSSIFITSLADLYMQILNTQRVTVKENLIINQDILLSHPILGQFLGVIDPIL